MKTKFSLKNKSAIITGGGSGIGKAIAETFSQQGALVHILDYDLQSAIKTVEAIKEKGFLATAHHCDVANFEQVSDIISDISSHTSVDILVNNAGGPPGGPLLSNKIDDFDAPFRRHLHAAHTITQILTPIMESEGYGRIVNIISTSVREPIDNIGLSNTLRGAMGSWAKSLSRELNPCITINNILPGFTDTDRLGSLAKSISDRTGESIKSVQDKWMDSVPIQRLIDPLETGAAVTWLCLPSSGSIRGISLAVDGGRMRSI